MRKPKQLMLIALFLLGALVAPMIGCGKSGGSPMDYAACRQSEDALGKDFDCETYR